MAVGSSRLVAAVLQASIVLTLLPSALAKQAFVVPWNTTKFGPDGPWQAVDIIVGGNDSTRYLNLQKTTSLQVYPGGAYQSLTFSNTTCTSYPDSLCGAGGTWNPDYTQILPGRSIAWSPSYADNTTGLKVPNARSLGAFGLTINQKTVWNATLASATSGSVTYPNGVLGGVTLGNLALGGDETVQVFTTSGTVGTEIRAAIFPGKLYDDGEIPSYSYGLHIGAAALDYPGSLVFGGYNKGRVIEPVTSFEDGNAVELLDIGIGVEFGGAPMEFKQKEKFLPSQVKVKPDPLSPYLSLPRQVCEKLAETLPISFDRKLMYYLWNKDDPNFERLVTSPAYLSFSFPPATGKTDNVVIKVPFALLNLTLSHPITDTPTQYFPCLPYDGVPVLGRAFLQAAFLGRNWEKKISWLAQAPGPGVSRRGLGDENTDIPQGATTITGYSDPNLFNSTWRGHWNVIASQEAGDNANAENGGSGNGNGSGGQGQTGSSLSTGAKAGIGVGAGLAAVAGLGALAFLLGRRRRRMSKMEPVDHAMPYTDPPKAPIDFYQSQGIAQMPADRPPEEMYQLPVEAPDTSMGYKPQRGPHEL